MKKYSKESVQNPNNSNQLSENNGNFGESKGFNANDIDEDAWYVCNKIWNLIETPISESTNSSTLHERLHDIQVSALQMQNLTFCVN